MLQSICSVKEERKHTSIAMVRVQYRRYLLFGIVCGTVFVQSAETLTRRSSAQEIDVSLLRQFDSVFVMDFALFGDIHSFTRNDTFRFHSPPSRHSIICCNRRKIFYNPESSFERHPRHSCCSLSPKTFRSFRLGEVLL